MNVLIVGGSNLLGQYLLRAAPPDARVTATWYTNYMPGCTLQLDVTNQSMINYVFGRVNPDVVIHLSAIGDVDYTEAHYQEAMAVNVLGTRNVIGACEDLHARLVYVSSNAVFGDGGPYAEDAERSPVNRYGATRKKAEDAVRESKRNWLILRLFLLFGWTPLGARTNWVQTIVRALRQKQSLSLVDDRFWQPTYAKCAAHAIWLAILKDLPSQTIHLASPEPVTLYELGLETARVFGLPADLISPVSSETLAATQKKTLARRPENSTYVLDKALSLGLALPSLAEELEMMKVDEPFCRRGGQ